MISHPTAARRLARLRPRRSTCKKSPAGTVVMVVSVRAVAVVEAVVVVVGGRWGGGEIEVRRRVAKQVGEEQGVTFQLHRGGNHLEIIRDGLPRLALLEVFLITVVVHHTEERWIACFPVLWEPLHDGTKYHAIPESARHPLA